MDAMNESTSPLPNDPILLQQMLLAEREKLAQNQAILADKEATIAQLQAQYQQMLEQWRLAQQKRFGRSSEAYSGQGDLFNELEECLADSDDEAPEQQETISYTRKKRAGRQPLPDELPREQELIDIADEDKTCQCCGHELHRMGEEVSEKLEFIPAQIKVIEQIRPKYSCRRCERDGTEVKVVIAPPKPALLPKSFATPSLLAQIISSKFQYGMPLYRQGSWFKQLGIELGRQTMSHWMLRCAAAAERLVALFKEQLLAQPAIHADETRLRVLNDDRAMSYMWVYCCGADSPQDGDGSPPIVLFDYQQGSRAGQCPVNYLQGYDGYLHVDGYRAYEQTAATLVGCWAHARRGFHEAQQDIPKGKTGKPHWALNLIQKLYRIESGLKGKSPEEKYAARQEKAKPLLAQFKQWLGKSALQVPPKSKLGGAIQYCLNQWDKLQVYLEDGRLSIDNNRAERAVRPFAVGRRNWLFSNTHNGANASAVLFSLVQTAKANDLSPFDYLLHIFNELPKLSEEDSLEHLLPWNVTLTNLPR